MAGAITYVYFGRSVVETINSLFPYSLSVGMFPYLCELAEKGDKKALGEVLDRTSRFMFFLFLPAAVVLVVAAPSLARFIFQLGKLAPEDATLIAVVTAYSALAMPFYGVERVMMKGYFSNRRTLAPTLIGILCSSLSMAACWLLVVRMRCAGELALVIVSSAAVGARVLKVALLAGVLKRQVPMFEPRGTLVFAAKVLVLSGVVVAVAWGAHQACAHALPLEEGLKGLKLRAFLAADIAVIGAAALAAFVLVAALLRMEEYRLAREWLRPLAAKLLGRLGLRGS
jgi:peptidoglycan biosynthesis protein MviN/MurJ (putative lipid II flippase)